VERQRLGFLHQRRAWARQEEEARQDDNAYIGWSILEHLSFVMFYAGTVITLALLIPYLGSSAADFMDLTDEQYDRLTTSPTLPSHPTPLDYLWWSLTSIWDYINKFIVLTTVTSSVQIVNILFLAWSIGGAVVIFTMIRGA